MATRQCPQCGGEYLATVERCVDCKVDLVDGAAQAASRTDVGAASLAGRVTEDRATGRIRYALDDWATETRVMIGQLLSGEEIPFLWEAGTLVVMAEFRVQVDGVVAYAEAAGAVFEPGTETSTYELDEWSDDQVNRLADALASAELRFEFDMEGNLVVAACDEEALEEIFDALELDDEDVADVDLDAATQDVQAVLSDLFVAVDRLRRDARNHEGVLGLVAAAEVVETLVIPFGFEPAVWNEIVSETRRLRSALEEDSMTDSEIEMNAGDLRILLHSYV